MKYKIVCMNEDKQVFELSLEQFVALFDRREPAPNTESAQTLKCSTSFIASDDDIIDQHYFKMKLDEKGYWDSAERERYMNNATLDVSVSHLSNALAGQAWVPTEEEILKLEECIYHSP